MQPKVGLALGAGGARGFAHIGVLNVLEEEQIPIDYIAGSSIGSLVGALFCLGHSSKTLEQFATLFRQKFYLDFTFPKMGFISGEKLTELLHLLTQGKNIEELPIPLTIVATDLLSGEKVLFREGSIADAIRASISIPGIFVPKEYNDTFLVDGGVVDRVPASVVKDMGAECIIAVDVSNLKAKPQMNSVIDVILQSIDIMQHEMVRSHELNTNIVIRPDLSNYSLRSFEHATDLIRIGRREAETQLAKIKQTIASWKE